MFPTGFTSFSALLLFPLSTTPSNTDQVFSNDPSVNAFVLGDFTAFHKDWLTYSSETERPGELCYKISISNDFIRMVNVATQILESDSHRPAL